MTTEIKTLHLDSVIEQHTQDLTGKVAAITGTTSGTGFVCARELAKLGAVVLLLNRDSVRSDRSFAQLHPGFALTNLQSTSAKSGGMDPSSPFMSKAQSAEDGALGIIRACADPAAVSGNFYGPQQWAGFPDLLPPEEHLFDPKNVRVNWDGCQVAVGKFTLPGLGGREGPLPVRS